MRALLLSSLLLATCAFAQYGPVTVTAQLGAGPSAILNWTASTTAGVSYNVYRSTTATGTPVQIAFAVSGLTFTDTGVAAGQTYYYVVRAMAESVNSNQVSAAIPAPAGPSATFVKSVATGTFGSLGHWTAEQSPVLPSYATLATTGTAYQWSGGPTCWYGQFFTFSLNLTDGKTHQVTFYAIDYDSTVRTEGIVITNTATGATLVSQPVTGFHAGVYEVFNVSGNVTIDIVSTAGANAVITTVDFD